MILVEQSGRQWRKVQVYDCGNLAHYTRWIALDNGEMCGNSTMQVRLRVATLKAEAQGLIVQLKAEGAA